MDRISICRDAYTVLDLMSAVGGLTAALYIIFAFLFLFFSVNNFDNFMVT